jgi:hypothetical protein
MLNYIINSVLGAFTTKGAKLGEASAIINSGGIRFSVSAYITNLTIVESNIKNREMLERRKAQKLLKPAKLEKDSTNATAPVAASHLKDDQEELESQGSISALSPVEQKVQKPPIIPSKRKSEQVFKAL